MSAARSCSAFMRDQADQDTLASAVEATAPERTSIAARGSVPFTVQVMESPHITPAETVKVVDVIRMRRNFDTSAPLGRELLSITDF